MSGMRTAGGETWDEFKARNKINTDVAEFNKGRKLSSFDAWDSPELRAAWAPIEVMQRRVFAAMRPVGEQPGPDKSRSGDTQFDEFIEKLTAS